MTQKRKAMRNLSSEIYLRYWASMNAFSGSCCCNSDIVLDRKINKKDLFLMFHNVNGAEA